MLFRAIALGCGWLLYLLTKRSQLADSEVDWIVRLPSTSPHVKQVTRDSAFLLNHDIGGRTYIYSVIQARDWIICTPSNRAELFLKSYS